MEASGLVGAGCVVDIAAFGWRQLRSLRSRLCTASSCLGTGVVITPKVRLYDWINMAETSVANSASFVAGRHSQGKTASGLAASSALNWRMQTPNGMRDRNMRMTLLGGTLLIRFRTLGSAIDVPRRGVPRY